MDGAIVVDVFGVDIMIRMALIFDHIMDIMIRMTLIFDQLKWMILC